jgi:hypothetical protein
MHDAPLTRFLFASITLLYAGLAVAADGRPGTPDIQVVRSSTSPVYVSAQGGDGQPPTHPGGRSGPGGLARAVAESTAASGAQADAVARGGWGASGFPDARGGDAEAFVRATSSQGDARSYGEAWGGLPGGNARVESTAYGLGHAAAGADAMTAGASSWAISKAYASQAGAAPQAWAYSSGANAVSDVLARGADGSTPHAWATGWGADVQVSAHAQREGSRAMILNNSATGVVTGEKGLFLQADSVMGTGLLSTYSGDAFAVANTPLPAAATLLEGRHGFDTIDDAAPGEAFITTTELLFHSGADARLGMSLLGLIDGSSRLDQASITILVDGVEMISRSFSSLSEAASYFGSQVLDLGPLAAGAHAFSLTTRAIGAADFGYAYSLSGVTPVPEPGSWLMLLAGLALVWPLCLRAKVGIVASHETTPTPYGQDSQVHPVLVPGPGRCGWADRRDGGRRAGAGLLAGRSLAAALRRLVDRSVQ